MFNLQLKTVCIISLLPTGCPSSALVIVNIYGSSLVSYLIPNLVLDLIINLVSDSNPHIFQFDILVVTNKQSSINCNCNMRTAIWKDKYESGNILITASWNLPSGNYNIKTASGKTYPAKCNVESANCNLWCEYSNRQFVSCNWQIAFRGQWSSHSSWALDGGCITSAMVIVNMNTFSFW